MLRRTIATACAALMCASLMDVVIDAQWLNYKTPGVPRAIQELAGHQDLGTTQRYLHLSPAAVVGAPLFARGRGDYGEAIPARVNASNLNRLVGGERGIRTLGRVSPTHAFQACAFNHSAISPHL